MIEEEEVASITKAGIFMIEEVEAIFTIKIKSLIEERVLGNLEKNINYNFILIIYIL